MNGPYDSGVSVAVGVLCIAGVVLIAMVVALYKSEHRNWD